MKPNALMDVSVSGTMTGEVIAMDFDPEATAHLTSVLTNLYSNRLLACVREYSTNAYDANIEAGSSEPIRVTTPNFASPYLIIQDSGLGMGIEKIRNTYSKYGASTKRDSNDFNGMLGVGSKAALTYTPNFTVISVHEGVRYTVSVSLNDEGLGEMQVVDTSHTDAASGVTVQIPIKRSDNYEVQREVADFFSFWPEGSVLVNGLAPERAKLTNIVGNIYTFEDNSRQANDLIVMGNVAYPVPGDRLLPENMPHFVYFAEIGEVNFSPSRESIRNDARAKQVVARVVQDYKDNFRDSLQKKVDEAESRAYAVVLSRILNAKYPGMDFKFQYDGEEVPSTFPKDEGFRFYRGEGATVNPVEEPLLFSEISRAWYLQSRTPEQFLDNVFIVTGAPKAMSPYNRTKLRKVVEGKYSGYDHRYYLTEREEVKSPWLKGIKTVTWEFVNKTFNAKKVKSKSDPTIYEMCDKAGVWEKRRTQPGEKYLFISPSEGLLKGFSATAKFWLTRLGYDYLVELSVNRHNKFLREHDAKHLPVAAREYSNNWVKKIPEERRFSMAVGNNNHYADEWKKQIDNILDPDEKSILERFDPALDKPWLDEYSGLIQHGYAPDLTHTRAGTVLFSGMPDLRWSFSSNRINNTLEIYNALYLYRKDKSNGSSV